VEINTHPAPRDLGHLDPKDKELLLALADLRSLADGQPAELFISSDHIQISHKLAAALGGHSAETIGLPPIVDLTLRTDAEGLVGSSTFRLRYEWIKNGQRQTPRRIGAILETSSGLRRLPLWLMEALGVADGFHPGRDDVEHWSALARFRQALDPGIQIADPNFAARVSMTDFLSGLQVRVADRFSITPNANGDDFDVVPFSTSRLESAGLDTDRDSVSEADGELSGEDLRVFQARVRDRGSVPAYRLRSGSFLVVDRSALPALTAIAEAQMSSADERKAFIRNPRPRITEAIETALRQGGRLEGLAPDAQEEAVEAAASPFFVETREYSERVKGVREYQKTLEISPGSGTTWLPEGFERQFAEAMAKTPIPDLKGFRGQVHTAIEKRDPAVAFDGMDIPARPEALSVIDAHIAQRETPGLEAHSGGNEKATAKPIILNPEENFEKLLWAAKFRERRAEVPVELPRSIRTPLKAHQVEGFRWQIAAWQAGLPGVLNADEQGLGKTLQTIAFLAWLKVHMSSTSASERGPVLVVAPTSLLENWEQEVTRHVADPGLGHLIRLFGGATSSRKLSGASGYDTEAGEAKLDLRFLSEAIQEGRAHRFWLLTTYTTLTNYQHSLGRIPFSAAVFDEIQALKNPDSLRAVAARSMNADFRIGLTGTPIENSSIDLWSVFEQLVPGALGSLKDFRERYGTPGDANMGDLHAQVFQPVGGKPALALRRLKESVARDLPSKSRLLHPRCMPATQASAYEDARLKLAQGGLGAALKMLHHIRTVSVHPASRLQDSDFISASARVQVTFDVLRRIASNRERCLVFIEHRQIQYRFIELARAEFGLDRIDLINGDTPIPQRQAIVNRFQRHLENDGGFDILVLGPKAAGIGLTLTAATHVLHLSRWWNPAVEEQCNDRVHRLGQARPVTIRAGFENLNSRLSGFSA
jgi:superfamily II DNA or RNA helicase